MTKEATIEKAGLIFVIGFAVLTFFLIAFGYADKSVFNPPGLRILLNTIFIFVTNIAVAIVSARSFLRYGQISFALLSSALVVSGLTAFISGWVSDISTNANFTIFNVGMLISSIIQAFGAVYLSAAPTFKASSKRKTVIAITWLLSIASILLLTALALSGLTSPFITETGPTPLRQFVVGLSFLFFALASIVFGYQYTRSKARALYWYCLALALLAIDALGSYSTTELGGILQWVGRIAFYVGGFYFVAVLLSLRQRLEGGAGFLERWFETFSSDPKAFAALFANMLSGFAYLRVIVDRNGEPVDYVLLEVNDAFEKNTGLRKEAVMGKRLTQVVAGIEKDPANWIDVLGNVALKGESAQLENYVEGLQKWFKVSAYSPQKGYVVTLFDDITERKRLQIQLEDYAKNLEKLVEERTRQLKDAERLATIGQVAGMVGHDIRNPLQAAVNELYFARKTAAEAPESQCKQATLESMNIIQEQVDYISKIISDLQDYAKPLQPNLVEVDLCLLIPEMLKTVHVPSNIQAKAACEDTSQLMLDPTFMRRILTNLVNNAIQAMPNGGKLTVRTFKKANKAIVAVEDTGIGIPDKIKSELFKPLFTTKAKGQGFGLPVVKRLVEAQSGTITFESQEGKGSKFIIELPIPTKNQ